MGVMQVFSAEKVLPLEHLPGIHPKALGVPFAVFVCNAT